MCSASLSRIEGRQQPRPRPQRPSSVGRAPSKGQAYLSRGRHNPLVSPNWRTASDGPRALVRGQRFYNSEGCEQRRVDRTTGRVAYTVTSLPLFVVWGLHSCFRGTEPLFFIVGWPSLAAILCFAVAPVLPRRSVLRQRFRHHVRQGHSANHRSIRRLGDYHWKAKDPALNLNWCPRCQ